MVRQSPRKTQKGPALQATTEAKVNGKAQKHASRAVAEEAQAPARQSKGASSNKRKSARAEEENDSYAEEENDKYSESSENERSESPPAKKKAKTAGRARTTKANANANSNASDNMILAERVSPTSLKKAMYIGAHISAAGGVQNSVQNALNIGGNAFALFLKSQRKWSSPPLSDEAAAEFTAAAAKHGYDVGRHVVPHGSYLVNLAQPDEDKAEQAHAALLDDLTRCHRLGIRLYNLHPGSSLGGDRQDALRRIASQLDRVHANPATGSVVTLLENMAGGGNCIGVKFEDLKEIIEFVKDKSRVGVCIDTCHAFAAGYDLRTPEAFEKTMAEFDRVVGLKYLKAFHMNDSKAPFASNRDLHANIGTGFLGLRAFHNIVNYAPFQGLPMVLETPIDRKDAQGKMIKDTKVWAEEIKLLESLIGMDLESDEFKRLENELQARGADERKKFQLQHDKKTEKSGKKPKGKGKKGKKEETTSDEEESD